MPLDPERGPPAPDPALLQRIITEEGIEAREESGLGERVLALARYLWDQAWAAAPSTGIDPKVLLVLVEVVAALLLISVVGLCILSLHRWLKGRKKRRRALSPSLLPAVVVEALAMPADPDGALERALAAGDARAALRALWVGLALSLEKRGLGRFGPEVTNRELVASVYKLAPQWPGLPALQRLARTVDRLLYGEVAPELHEVRALAADASGLRTP